MARAPRTTSSGTYVIQPCGTRQGCRGCRLPVESFQPLLCQLPVPPPPSLTGQPCQVPSFVMRLQEGQVAEGPSLAPCPAGGLVRTFTDHRLPARWAQRRDPSSPDPLIQTCNLGSADVEGVPWSWACGTGDREPLECHRGSILARLSPAETDHAPGTLSKGRRQLKPRLPGADHPHGRHPATGGRSSTELGGQKPTLRAPSSCSAAGRFCREHGVRPRAHQDSPPLQGTRRRHDGGHWRT
jgi:hypothetical protein